MMNVFVMSRGVLVAVLAAFSLDPAIPAPAPEVAGGPEIHVYRSPSCGCCGKWLDRMRQNGFRVIDTMTDDMPAIKTRYGVPASLQSCHTAVVDGYVIEGHVPADDIRSLLKNRPATRGLAVPGMPTGTPGMEMGGRRDPYAVLQFGQDGSSRVFRDYTK